MKNLLLVLVIVVVVAGAYLGRHKLKDMFMGGSAPTPQTTMEPTAAPEAMSGASGATVATNGLPKEFTVVGTEFAFTPNTLMVAVGDTVKVTFTNNGTYPHNFTIDALNVKGKTIQPGQSDVVTFAATKAGTYQYYCSVPGHKDKGMVGTLTVK